LNTLLLLVEVVQEAVILLHLVVVVQEVIELVHLSQCLVVLHTP
jgi:hypothetical protein